MTTRTTIGTRRDTLWGVLGLLAMVIASAALMMVLLSFLFRPSPWPVPARSVVGSRHRQSSCPGREYLPVRHASVPADTEFAGRAIVTFDDGTGQSATLVRRSLPTDGNTYSSGESTDDRCDADGVCWGKWHITPTLNVTVYTTYRGVECVITVSTATRAVADCGGVAVPN